MPRTSKKLGSPSSLKPERNPTQIHSLVSAIFGTFPFPIPAFPNQPSSSPALGDQLPFSPLSKQATVGLPSTFALWFLFLPAAMAPSPCSGAVFL